MAGKNEQLGIELSLSLDGKFADLIKQIENAFSKIDLKGFEGKVAGLEGKLGGVTKKLSDVAKTMASLNGGDASNIELKLDASQANKEIVKLSSDITKFGKIAHDATGEIFSPEVLSKNVAKAQDQIRKLYSNIENYSAKANKDVLSTATAMSKIASTDDFGKSVLDKPGKTVTLYHGGSSDTSDAIMKEGIKPNKKYGLGIAELEQAKLWAQSDASTRGAKDAIVYKVEIPKEAITRLIKDHASNSSPDWRSYNADLATTNIKPEWIKAVKTGHGDFEPTKYAGTPSTFGTDVRGKLAELTAALNDPKITPSKLNEVNRELKELSTSFNNLKAKGVASAAVDNSSKIASEEAAAWRARNKELGAHSDKLTEINKAYAQKSIQDGAFTPTKVASTTEAAYKARERDVQAELAVARQAAKMRQDAAAAEEVAQNKLVALKQKEDVILDSLNRKQDEAEKKRVAAELKNINDKATARDKVNNTSLKALSRHLDSEESLRNKALLQQENFAKKSNSINNTLSSNGRAAGGLAPEIANINKLRQDASSKVDIAVSSSSVASVRDAEVAIKKLSTAHSDLREKINNSNRSFREQEIAANKSSKAFGLFNMSIGNMSKRLAEFYLIRGVFFGISNQINTAVTDLIKFNQAIADTAAITNASVEGVKSFSQAAQMIARNSKMDLQEVMKLMNLLSQSGVSEKDVPLVSKVTAMFATGTGSSAENAVRVMTTSLNVWGIEANKSAMVADTLTAGLNSAKLEVNELSTVFNYLAPMAKQAGYSIQETTAIIATMSQMGVKASTIGTGTGQLLTRLMAPTKGVKDLAKAYNIELEELNPRMHKFSEIIKTLSTADGGKAVPVQDLLKGFGQIAGRSVSAAVTAGAEYFKEMERNVSLGNASLVAYSKTLDGVGSKLNVLRQTFVQLLGSISSFNGILGVGYEGLLSLTRGLMSAEGKVVAAAVALTALSAALYVCRTAITAFLASNPLTLAFAALGTVLTGVIVGLGSLSNETQKAAREHDLMARKMGDAQRAYQLLSGMYGKAAEAGTLNNEISKEHREEIDKLVRTTPSLHGVIDTSTRKYGELTKSMKAANDQMSILSSQNMNSYNTIIDRLEAAKNKRGFGGLSGSYNSSMKDIDIQEAKRKEYINTREGVSPEETKKALAAIADWANKERDKARDTFASNADNRKLMDLAGLKMASMSYAEPINPAKNNLENLEFSKFRPAAPTGPSTDTTRKTPTPGLGTPAGQIEKDLDLADALRKYRNQVTKDVEKLTTKELENQIKRNLEDLKDTTNSSEYEAKSQYIRASYDVYKARLVDAYTTEQWTAVASAIGASYEGGKLIFPDSEKGRKDYANYSKSTDIQKGFTDKVKDAVAAKVKEAESTGELKDAQIPEFKLPKAESIKLSKDTTLRDEKVQANQLSKLDFELTQRKNQAKSAAELRELELEGIANQKASAEILEAVYKKRLLTVESEGFLRSYSEEWNADLLVARDNVEAIELKLKGINAQQKETANIDFFHNAAKGAGKAFTNMGDFKSNTEQLGTDVATQGLNGMVTVIDESITKLSTLEGTWRSFGNSMANIMKDIAKTLQQYIAKMLVVWAVQKLIGLMTPAATTSADGLATTGGYNFEGPVATRFMAAEGGQVPLGMGTPGVDSVPALLMPSEYVVRASAVEKYGVEFMHELNAGRVKRFAEGGSAGGFSAKSAGSSDKGTPFELNIFNIVDPKSIPQQLTGQEVINIINFDLAKRGQSYQQIKGIVNG